MFEIGGNSLKDIITPYLIPIEAQLKSSLSMSPPGLEGFYGMMRYHLGWLDEDLNPTQTDQGKRLRPVLCLLGCEAAGGEVNTALPAAASLELLHNFTLIHDDIEDNSDRCRYRNTVWKIWGVPQAINAGDGLFSVAHLALLQLMGTDLPPYRTLEIVREFERTVLIICEGQYMDISFETQPEVSTGEYLEMIEKKTAALLSASLKLGAMTGTAPDSFADSLAEAGRLLGLAFQIRDDEIGVWGNPAVTGKPTAADIYQKKRGFPVVCALETAPVSDKKRLLAAYAKDVLTEDDVEEVLGVLDRASTRDNCILRGKEFYQQGLAALPNPLSESSAVALQKIHRLAAALSKREY